MTREGYRNLFLPGLRYRLGHGQTVDDVRAAWTASGHLANEEARLGFADAVERGAATERDRAHDRGPWPTKISQPIIRG